jgi:hypothetical protein
MIPKLIAVHTDTFCCVFIRTWNTRHLKVYVGIISLEVFGQDRLGANHKNTEKYTVKIQQRFVVTDRLILMLPN